MTVAPETETHPVPEGHVRLTIDGVEVDAPEGELIIRAAERIGAVIPRFCDHPLLDPAGACRQCLVEVEVNGKPMPKPAASCTIRVSSGMVVRTQQSSAVADKAQQGVMELLLINHPLDCPICDKGGECPLQNQALKHGRAVSRFRDEKRTFPKPISINSQILLDRERCVLCQRCTRFAQQIAGDPFIEMLERGPQQQIGTAEGHPGTSYFSGNTIQICPVGALTSEQYRFRSRPFDLVSTPGQCEHCASGCEIRNDWRRGSVMRRLAGNDPEVNEEWICDKGRFAFRYADADDRIRRPLVRENGALRQSSWTEALRLAADGLARARADRGVGVLPGGRLTREDAYAYAKFARAVLGTNDVDCRARPHSAEELRFLESTVAGATPGTGGVTYRDLESAPAVVSVAFEPEEESPIVFLRLRKAARDHGTRMYHVAPWRSPGVDKTTTIALAGGPLRAGDLVPCAPGGEAAVLADPPAELAEALASPGSVLLVGERAAEVPGLYSEVLRTAHRTGARVAWVPRRAGERGAIDAGALPSLLPGGHPVGDAAVREELERAWGLAAGAVPSAPGRDAAAMLRAAAEGALSGLLCGGFEVDDLPDPQLGGQALASAGFVVSCEIRPSAVTEHADVVLPVAPAVEKSGTYLDWEGRERPFSTTIDGTGAVADCRVLDTLAVEMDVDIYTQTPAVSGRELARLSEQLGPPARPREPDDPLVAAPPAGPGQALLATWQQLLDNGSMQVDEPALAGTAREVRAVLSPGTARGHGLAEGQSVSLRTARGAITLPVTTAEMPDGVVWVPGNSGHARVRRELGGGHGTRVDLVPVGAADPGAEPAGARRNGHHAARAGAAHDGTAHDGGGEA
ncbi:NADH-quinone oxidoreductase subunit G [Salinifilum ghardaiensis]